MAELLLVPEVAAGATEVVVAEWLVTAGQSFKAGDALAVIETEKAVVEVVAETDATLLKALAAAGSEAEVGSPMALLGIEEEVGSDLDALLHDLGASAAGPAPSSEAPSSEAPSSEAPSSEAPSSEAPSSEAPSSEAPSSEVKAADSSAPAASSPAPAGETGRQFISPIARKLLRGAGVEQAGITGTGPNGRIQRRDVEAAIEAHRTAARAAASEEAAAARQATSPVSPEAPAGNWTEVPHTRLRRTVASRLAQSKQDIPHFYVRRTAVLDDLLTLRAQLNEHSPVKISVNDFIIRAVAVAHRAVPKANVIWTDEAMREYDSVDISVAVASERGLVTPVLRGVETSSLSAISTSVKSLVEQANSGRLQQKDLEGGSITVTNLGMFGVEEFSAIINPPQSAILAIGAGVPTARVVDGVVTAATTVSLVLSVDHRAIDGALAAQWMAALVAGLENPLSLVV